MALNSIMSVFLVGVLFQGAFEQKGISFPFRLAKEIGWKMKPGR